MLNSKYELLKDQLEGFFPKSNILLNEPMSKHTTFKIGGPADLFIEVATSEVVQLVNVLRNQQIPFTVIGNGSNLLVSDEGIEGVVISFGKLSSEIIVTDDLITAEAGAMLSTVANTALKNGLTGLEFAAGIPGSVGGAVYMNAGAYGGEIKDVIISATVLTPDYQFVEYTKEDLALSYRHSALMEDGGIVLNMTIQLEKGNPDDIKATMDDFKERRISKQPLNYPSAGSTFKRPEGYFAGKLIEDAGLKGFTVGGAQVSEKHSGFVINIGNATAKDVLKLIQEVDSKVFGQFGVHLEPEVRIIGRGI